MSWRRSGFGDSTTSCSSASARWRRSRATGAQTEASEGEPVWFERCFAFKLGPHLLRGRVDRVDRHPDGSYELIDYKTGKAKTADELREDVQLSLYQMGARESWRLETSAQSYFYVLSGEQVPWSTRPRSSTGCARPCGDRRRNPEAALRADPVARDLPLLRLPDHLPGG